MSRPCTPAPRRLLRLLLPATLLGLLLVTRPDRHRLRPGPASGRAGGAVRSPHERRSLRPRPIRRLSRHRRRRPRPAGRPGGPAPAPPGPITCRISKRSPWTMSGRSVPPSRLPRTADRALGRQRLERSFPATRPPVPISATCSPWPRWPPMTCGPSAAAAFFSAAWRAARSPSIGTVAWTVVPSPNVGDRYNELVAASALSTNDVWAAGTSYILSDMARTA